VIASIRHKGLRRLAERNDASGISADLVKRIKRILQALEVADNPDMLGGGLPPGIRLHALKGTTDETWSLSVSGNWRITAVFRDGKFSEVDLVDYH